MKRKIRWGVIASGGISRRRTIPEGIVPAKNAELVAVWGRNQKTNAEVAGQFGVPAARTLDELLAMDLDDLVVERVVLDYLKHARHTREIQIVNGLERGNLTAAVEGRDVGTIIHA